MYRSTVASFATTDHDHQIMKRQSIKLATLPLSRPRHRMLLFVLVVVLYALGNIKAWAVTYRDNTVKMALTATGYEVVVGTYQIRALDITPGQDPNNHVVPGDSKSYSGNDGSLTYSIGRQGSAEVAKWFTEKVRADQTTFNDNPGDLNFGFQGTLTLRLKGGVLGPNQATYTLEDIMIAQGNALGSNNWWFGGKTCTYIGNNKVRCTGTSSSGYTVNFTFQRGGVSNSVNEIDLVAIDYPGYQLFPLQPQYVGESTSCKWQPPSACPPDVMYYNSTQANTVKLTVKDGLLYDSVGQPFDTTTAQQGYAIFVLAPDGSVYASNVKVTYLFHHSTMLGGASVASAGYLWVSRGHIDHWNNCSGHYKPVFSVALIQFKEAVVRSGYTENFSADECASSDAD